MSKQFCIAFIATTIVISVLAVLLPASFALADWEVDGSYNLNIGAADQFVQGGDPNVPFSKQFTEGDTVLPRSDGSVFEADTQEVKIGNSDAIGGFTLRGQVGQFKLSTVVTAAANRTTGGQPLFAVNASGQANATLYLYDSLVYHSKQPGRHLISASWAVSGGLAASATGVTSTGQTYDSFDYVNASAQSWFTATGTGIGPAPFDNQAGAIPVPDAQLLWGYTYNYNGGIIPRTVPSDHQDPVDLIPLSFYAKDGDHLNVSWTFSLSSQANIVNSAGYFLDSTGSAITQGELDHTISWNGISSVVDATTGAPIDDWSITSDSGFDYSQPYPVPEPSTLALLALGSLGLLVRRARLAR